MYKLIEGYMYITYMQQTFIHETMMGNGEKIFVYI